MHTKKLNVKQILTPLFILYLVSGVGSADAGSVNDIVDDSVITTKVKTELAKSDQTSALSIHVETYKGAVQLCGFIDSEAERQAAETITHDINGVKSVKNSLIVK